MTKDPANSFRETYVLDEDMLSELDDLSLTGVMRDATNTVKRMKIEQDSDGSEGSVVDDADSGSGQADDDGN